MRRRLPVTLAALMLVLTAFAGGAASAASSNDDELLKDEQHRLTQLEKEYTGKVKGGSAVNMEAVGHTAIGNRGFNADVWVHEQYAYVGHWGFADWATGNDRFCPSGEASGVSVIDTRDPADPVVVSRLQNPPSTSAEDVVVFTARYGPLAGHDIAAVGLQTCGSRFDRAIPRGLQVFDVTNPAAPVEIGRLDSGCCTRGIHEFEIAHRADLGRTYAYAAVPTSGYDEAGSRSGVRDEQGRGDFRLVDLTDPAAPVEVSDWGLVADDVFQSPGLGCDADPNYGHSAEPSEDGKTAFVSYWDSGFIALDVSDPANPVYRGRTTYPATADGDAHSSSYDEERQLLFTADEDFCRLGAPTTEYGFGYMRVFDYSNLANPVQVGQYKTPNTAGTGDPGAGDFVIHNPLVVGTDVYLSWYTDGIRVVDTSDPANPVEVASFVPPAGKNPVKPSQRGVLTNTTQVWGVAVDTDRDLVFASDMNTGLWILRRTD